MISALLFNQQKRSVWKFAISLILVLSTQKSFAYTAEDIDYIREGLKGKVVFFMGYPGSGKGTQGKIFQDLLKIPHVSTGELFRAEAKKGTAIGLEMAGYMKDGLIIPSQITFDYLDVEFGKDQYKNGFILDGYPKNKECYDFILGALKRKNLELLTVIHFNIEKDEAERRLTQRLLCAQCEKSYHLEDFKAKEDQICKKCQKPLEVRQDDHSSAIQKRLSAYEDSTGPLYPLYEAMGVLRSIEVPSTPDEMTDRIVSTLKQAIELDRRVKELPRSSYFLRPLEAEEKENSSVFHNHLDAKDHFLLREMVAQVNQAVPSAQNKIYPISHLQIGPQTSDGEFASVYHHLPNFHSIVNAKHEAFATGKMGDSGIDYEQVLSTLKVAFAHPHQGVMTEIEEDIFAFSLGADTRMNVTLNRGNTPYQLDWSKLPGWKEKMIHSVPKFELHHGFDIDKLDSETNPPISLEKLMAETQKAGFRNGGWFIFSKEHHWAYRSNEFSNQDYETEAVMLIEQAVDLRKMVRDLLPIDDQRRLDINISSSMEKVHAIWQVE